MREMQTDASKNPGRIGDRLIHLVRLKTECWNGFFDIDERLRELLSKGDDMERLKRLVDFECFAPTWRRLLLARIDARVGGRRSIMC
jgi:hypothetical protein